MAVRVASRSGRTVRMPAQERSVEGRLRLRWEGRNDGGTRLRNGAYSVVVRVRDLAGNGASTRKRVVVDTAPPRLFWRAEAGVVGARALTVRFRTTDASGPLRGRLRLDNAYGRRVRRWREQVPLGPGRVTVARRIVLAATPGVHRLRVILRDRAGHRSRTYTSPAYRFDHGTRSRVVARVENVGRRVALTFDGCAFANSWASILNTLARHRVRAAFFCPGQQVRAYPRLARRTIRAGHTVGSHGWDHATLTAFSYSSILWRLQRDRNVWWHWRAAATPYLRPPYGAFGPTVLSAAGALGYRYTVVWDVDPRDWSSPGVEAIVARAVSPQDPDPSSSST